MRTVVLVSLLFMALSSFAGGCDTGTKIPREAVVKATGLLNSGSGGLSSFDKQVRGGQVVYVKVVNANILGAGVVVKISSGGKELCATALVILPKQTQTFSSGVFSDRAVTYDVSVSPSEGSEVIANITVLTLPEPKEK
jgi:hypothetical protein